MILMFLKMIKIMEKSEEGNVEKVDKKDKTNDDSDVEKDNEDTLLVSDGNTSSAEYVAKALSTDDIIKIYKNVEQDLSKSTISTDDILKMYDTDIY